MQPPGGPREPPRATGESFSPPHEAALHLAGLRVRLDASAAWHPPRHATSRAPKAPSRLPTVDSLEQGTPTRAGAGLLPAAECAPPGPRQLLRRARARARSTAFSVGSWTVHTHGS